MKIWEYRNNLNPLSKTELELIKPIEVDKETFDSFTNSFLKN